MIGGPGAGEGNVIAYNRTSGYEMRTCCGSFASGGTVRGNSIYANGGLGITLLWGGTTPLPNDAGDGDASSAVGNEGRNYPVLGSATTGGAGTTITGTLDTIPGLSVTLDFYASDTGDPSGHGEGRYYLGATSFVAGSDPTAFSATLPVLLAAGQVVTATTTDERGNTSEFSRYLAVTVTNSPPIADAGADATTTEHATGTLDGSASSDPDGDALRYTWTQIAGPAVTLDRSDPARPMFAAPTVETGGATLTFQLVVSDGQLDSEPDTVNVTVTNVNRSPVADAGDELMVGEGSPVALDGTRSFDPDDDALTFTWQQIGGPTVTLSDSSTATPAFTAPSVGVDGATLVFELTVSDGLAASSDTVRVLVDDVNHPPVADAGADQTRAEGSVVALDGAASTDPDGDHLTYRWEQIGGPPVELSDATSATPAFTAPMVGPGGETLVFRLVVDDGAGDDDDVRIVVQNVNDPPACAEARPTSPRLWPPNHKLLAVGITGVGDPNSDAVSITIDRVTQDEPIDGLGDGDTSPDAVLRGGTALLRAERSGTGNGRVYAMHFTADDGQGGRCTGQVTVGVPHDMKPGRPLVDDGQSFDSTR